MEEFRIKIGSEDLIIQTGEIARQANGSVLATYGGSSVLATVCCSAEPKENLDFVPLSVDYNERYYAAGKIPGGFLKREARPKDKEILVSRLIDRPMRPLFSKAFGREIQVVPMTVSTDSVNPPDIVGMMAAFAAVMISDIPFNGPVSALRVAKNAGNYIVNPSFTELEESSLDIVIAGNNDGICMVEGGGLEVLEQEMLEAINIADKELKRLNSFLVEIQEKCGKPKLKLAESTYEFKLENDLATAVRPLLEIACFEDTKEDRSAATNKAKTSVLEQFAAQLTEEDLPFARACLNRVEKELVRRSILEKGRRSDSRTTDAVRPISSRVNVLARTHGSALFTRGETQSLGVLTLGGVMDEQIMDDIDGNTRNNFMLHYNFPPYSVGETGRLGTGRREIGHGHLAHRAIEAILPTREKFPYTLRIVSEILESNGSSSMATVCSASMSLMDAGVPIKNPVAGIAMGLVKEADDYAVLSDILGEEDHLGDMDFKVAGTSKGITAFQMDIKIAGLSIEIMTKALEQALAGRLHILAEMAKTISTAKTDMAENAPRIYNFSVDKEKIGAIIGPAGKNIRAISEKTSSKVDISQDGVVTIFGQDRDSVDEAKAMIMAMVSDPEPGTIYSGTIKRVMDYGAFIEILPGKEGLCHISKVAKERVEDINKFLKEGDTVKVKLLEIDRMGRLNLSISDAS